MANLGDRIKYLREKRGLTQKDLCNATGLSIVQVSRYENNERKPDPSTLSAIADALETNSDYLLGRTDDHSPTPKGTISEDDPNVGRAFLGGAKSYSDEEIEIAKAAARAAVDAYRKGRQKGGK